ncbi:head-tail joining protein [Pseudomonas alloputida]|uniref:head-tail joining protein n=1 Tax=Pseudomonas alloputida TaxID=1940621 RepID=UPI0032085AAC
MARPSFRERMAFRTGRILERVGDSATLEDGSKVLGVFSNPALDPQLGSKRMARGVDAAELDEPRFTVLSAIAERLPRGAALTVELPAHEGGGPYTVVRPEPTGDGMVALVLEVKHARTADIF